MSDTACPVLVDRTTLYKIIQFAMLKIYLYFVFTCDGTTQDNERFCDLIYMVIIWVAGVGGGGIEVGRREGTLRVRGASRR